MEPHAVPRYSAAEAEIYGGLGIQGTTYEIAFDAVGRTLGDLQGLTALDFGSGAGRSAAFLAAMGAAAVIGADHNPAMIAAARAAKVPRARFVQVDRKLPLDDASVDVAISMSVFIEIRTLERMTEACREVHRVLKQGGRFLVETTNPAAYSGRYRNFEYSPPPTWSSGERARCRIIGPSGAFTIDDTYWTERDYTGALSDAGFTVVSTERPLPPSTSHWDTDEATVPPFLIVTAVKDA